MVRQRYLKVNPQKWLCLFSCNVLPCLFFLPARVGTPSKRPSLGQRAQEQKWPYKSDFVHNFTSVEPWLHFRRKSETEKDPQWRECSEGILCCIPCSSTLPGMFMYIYPPASGRPSGVSPTFPYPPPGFSPLSYPRYPSPAGISPISHLSPMSHPLFPCDGLSRPRSVTPASDTDVCSTI